MKKFLVVSLLSSLFVLSMALTMNLNVDPPANSECNAICISLGDLGLNHGQCVSFCNSCRNNGNTQANCICNELDFAGAIGEGGFFKNFGQCIKALK